MIHLRMRASCVAIASASLLFASMARAQDPPAVTPAVPAAPPAAEPAAPPLRESPPNVPPTAMPTIRRVDASEPRKITGIVLTSIGIYHGIAGTVVLGALATAGGGDGGLGLAFGLLFGGPLMGEGLILSCIGIPLWVSGAKTVVKVDEPLGGPQSKREAPTWVPEVEVGAGTGAVTWRF